MSVKTTLGRNFSWCDFLWGLKKRLQLWIVPKIDTIQSHIEKLFMMWFSVGCQKKITALDSLEVIYSSTTDSPTSKSSLMLKFGAQTTPKRFPYHWKALYEWKSTWDFRIDEIGVYWWIAQNVWALAQNAWALAQAVWAPILSIPFHPITSYSIEQDY